MIKVRRSPPCRPSSPCWPSPSPPSRRRLALAPAAIAQGAPLTRAAADAGFTDHSHLTRQFRRAYGFTPARWRDLQVTG